MIKTATPEQKAAIKKVLDKQTLRTLSRWWTLTNCWKIPDDFPQIEGLDSGALWRELEARRPQIGERLINEEWAKHIGIPMCVGRVDGRRCERIGGANKKLKLCQRCYQRVITSRQRVRGAKSRQKRSLVDHEVIGNGVIGF